VVFRARSWNLTIQLGIFAAGYDGRLRFKFGARCPKSLAPYYGAEFMRAPRPGAAGIFVKRWWSYLCHANAASILKRVSARQSIGRWRIFALQTAVTLAIRFTPHTQM
jgi:hypothetical protein